MRPARSAALLFVLAACGGGQKAQLATAQSGLTVALTATNAARETMLTWSSARESTIVAGASFLEDGKAKLAAHRARIDAAVLVFVAAYSAIATAQSALALAASDSKRLADAVRLVGDALRATLLVREAVAALRGVP